MRHMNRISIHAPREGSDPLARFPSWVPAYFYPRSPRGERRRGIVRPSHLHNFYPRSPRGERPALCCPLYPIVPISIHAPREGSDPCSPDICARNLAISIHAPREGSDVGYFLFVPRVVRFLSTLPARGATCFLAIRGYWVQIISIHAPREGSDPGTFQRVDPGRQNFYPRSPRGERPQCSHTSRLGQKFLSTLPARGATANVLKNKRLSSAAFV